MIVDGKDGKKHLVFGSDRMEVIAWLIGEYRSITSIVFCLFPDPSVLTPHVGLDFGNVGFDQLLVDLRICRPKRQKSSILYSK